jgi:hypothetical protein
MNDLPFSKIIFLFFFFCAIQHVSGQRVAFQKEISVGSENVMNFDGQPEYYLLKESTSSDFVLYVSERLSSAIVRIDTSLGSYHSFVLDNTGQDASKSGIVTYNQHKIRKLARKSLANMAYGRSFIFEEIDTETGLRAQNKQAVKIPSNEYILSYFYRDRDNKYFILTLSKRSNVFNIYEVSLNAHSKSSIDLSSADIRPFKFIGDLLKDEGFEASYIDRRVPKSIGYTYHEIKYFLDDDILTVTFDNQQYETILFELDLINLSGTATKIKKDYVSCGELKSNSYLFEGHLYSLRGCEKNVVFSIKDIQNDSLIYKEILYNDQPLPEGYSDLYSEGFFNMFGFRETESGVSDLKEINKFFIAKSCFPVPHWL